jgi:hypothetical protein
MATKADTAIQKLTFSFERCGPFGSPREIQALTRSKRDEIRKLDADEAAE